MTDEELRLLQAATQTHPPAKAALEAYRAFLERHDPTRAGFLGRRMQGESLSIADLGREARAWRAAWCIPAAVDELEFAPLPSDIHLSAADLPAVSDLLERHPRLLVTLQFGEWTRAGAARALAVPAAAKLRRVWLWAHTDIMDPSENCQSILRTYHGRTALQALCDAPNLRHLEELGLSGEECGDQCGVWLAGATFERLQRLYVSSEHIGDTGALALAGSPVLKTVRTLHLTGCRIGPVGARALAKSPYLAALEDLNLYGNNLDDATKTWLRTRSPFQHLPALVL